MSKGVILMSRTNMQRTRPTHNDSCSATKSRTESSLILDVPMSAELALNVDWAAPSAVLIALRQLHPVGA